MDMNMYNFNTKEEHIKGIKGKGHPIQFHSTHKVRSHQVNELTHTQLVVSIHSDIPHPGQCLITRFLNDL